MSKPDLQETIEALELELKSLWLTNYWNNQHELAPDLSKVWTAAALQIYAFEMAPQTGDRE
jgi:hypothetical protein